MKLTKEQLIQNLINNKSYREASDELIQYIEQMDPENMEILKEKQQRKYQKSWIFPSSDGIIYISLTKLLKL